MTPKGLEARLAVLKDTVREWRKAGQLPKGTEWLPNWVLAEAILVSEIVKTTKKTDPSKHDT